MTTCTACGQQLGEGRFCPHCGAPVDSAPGAAGQPSLEDTAERPVPVPPESPLPPPSPAASGTAPTGPRTPPSAVAPPPPPRYPLYADEVDSWKPYGPVVPSRPDPVTPAEPVEAQPAPISAGTWISDDEPTPDPEPVAPTAPHAVSREPGADDDRDEHEYDDYDDDERSEHRSPLLWMAAAVVVLAVVATGWFHLARDSDDGPTARDSAGPAASSDGEAADVAGDATAKAPRTAPPNEDVSHQRVTYGAANMLDGDPTTAWRVAGAATGMTLTFTLDASTELSSVGLVNGYAKTSQDDQGRSFDWYAGNRRIKAVVWSFDDGPKVRQQFKDGDPKLQSTDIDPVTTRTVSLRIVRVTGPGGGIAARNYTAISEVSLVGVPES